MKAARKIIITENFVNDKMKEYDSGHDWWHVLRVRSLARYINSVERSANPFILDISAILHDVADSKFSTGDSSERYRVVSDFLLENDMEDIKDEIIDVVSNVSFSNKNPSGNLKNPGLLILQDADKLDAIGAIGIARAFNYGGFRNNPIYIPGEKTEGNSKSTIGHFYDKLLKLKDMMNTETGLRIAIERHNILLNFLDQFYSEWKFGMKGV
jgi:uncharacterized protein